MSFCKAIRVFCSLSLIISITLVQSGCSMLGGSRQSFSVMTSEQDANIWINGQLVGKGSLKTLVPRDESVTIMAKKDGFYPSTQTVGTKMSMLGLLDVIGGFIILVPFIGLAFPGSRTLDTNSVVLQMFSTDKDK